MCRQTPANEMIINYDLLMERCNYKGRQKVTCSKLQRQLLWFVFVAFQIV